MWNCLWSPYIKLGSGKWVLIWKSRFWTRLGEKPYTCAFLFQNHEPRKPRLKSLSKWVLRWRHKIHEHVNFGMKTMTLTSFGKKTMNLCFMGIKPFTTQAYAPKTIKRWVLALETIFLTGEGEKPWTCSFWSSNYASHKHRLKNPWASEYRSKTLIWTRQNWKPKTSEFSISSNNVSLKPSV